MMRSPLTTLGACLTWLLVPGCLPAFCQAPGDFNKIGVYHQNGVDHNGYPLLSVWYVDSNGNFAWDAQDSTYAFGLNTDLPVMGDWTGTHHLQMGVYRGGLWLVDWNDNHYWDAGDQTFSWGTPGDIPVVGDWTHTGKLQIGVVRNINGAFYWYVNTSPLCGSSNPSGCDYSYTVNNVGSQYVQVFQYGLAGDVPVIGNWNHQGVLGVGVYRPSQGFWYIKNKAHKKR